MNSPIPPSLNELIKEFSKFPGIGKKTAERLSMHVLKTKKDDVLKFSNAIKDIKENIKCCLECHCFIEDDTCSICNDNNRINNVICIVEDASDVFLINKSGYKGLYHVLGGLISPLDGVTYESLNIKSLMKRLNDIKEVIIALDPSSEGDMTNLYLFNLLKKYSVKVSRLARGVPVGSSLEFIDQVTLTHSINDRIEVKE